MNTQIRLSTELYNAARIASVSAHRSVGEQVQYWALVGRTCIENPKLPVNFVVDSLQSLSTNETDLIPFFRK